MEYFNIFDMFDFDPLWRDWKMCAEVFLVILILCASNWVCARLINSLKFSAVIIKSNQIQNRSYLESMLSVRRNGV